MRRIHACVFLVACLVACEREGQPQLWRAPKVGDRGMGLFEFTAKIAGPDGRTHTLENHNEFTSEIMDLDAEFPTRIRMTMVRHGHSLDGVAKPGISGTFDLTQTADALEVTHVGGTLTAEEREFFTSSRRPTRTTSAASKRFLLQTFKPGKVLVLTPDEIVGLGFGMSSVELTVTDVTAKQVTFEIKTVGELSGMGGTMNATGTLRLFAGGRELVQDGEILREGKHIGELHIEQRSHAL